MTKVVLTGGGTAGQLMSQTDCATTGDDHQSDRNQPALLPEPRPRIPGARVTLHSPNAGFVIVHAAKLPTGVTHP